MTGAQTKAARHRAAEQIIDRNSIGVPFCQADLTEFSEAVGRHLLLACREVCPDYPSNRRHIMAWPADEEQVRPFSWRKEINLGNDEQRRDWYRLVAAMRKAIRGQRDEFWQAAPRLCITCGESTAERLAVDHKWPPFSALMASFIAENGGADPEVKSLDYGGVELAGEDELKRWQAFHRGRAEFQILCTTCNSKKGARISA